MNIWRQIVDLGYDLQIAEELNNDSISEQERYSLIDSYKTKIYYLIKPRIYKEEY